MAELKEKFYDLVWKFQDAARDPKKALMFGAGAGFVIGLAIGYMGRL